MKRRESASLHYTDFVQYPSSVRKPPPKADTVAGIVARCVHWDSLYGAFVKTAIARPSRPSLGFLLMAVVIVSVLPSTLKKRT